MEQIKKDGRGGARPGAGRKPGGPNNFTIQHMLTSVEQQSGRSYEDLLVEDFLNARNSDKGLAQKYHNLILSKMAPTLQRIETTEGEDAIQAKALAFAEALKNITGTRS